MRSGSIVKQATIEGRRAVTMALVGAGLIAAALIGERVVYQAEQKSDREHLLAANNATGMLIYLDEQQTNALNLAIETGEERWVERYLQTIPQAEAQLNAALALAPAAEADALRRDAEETGATIRALADTAIEAIRDGRLTDAQAIVKGEAYAALRLRVTDGGLALYNAVMGEADRRIGDRAARATATLIAIILIAFVSGAGLWRRLTTKLRASENALGDAEDTIREMAQTDVLTGLANRRAFVDVLDATLPRAKRAHAGLSVLMIDLDNFKPVNDRHGHLVGDLALKEAAHRLRGTLRGEEFAARIGGDEFVVLVEHEQGAATPQQVAERIVKRLSAPYTVDGLTVRLGASVGIATFPTDSADAQDLLRKADVALYAAKEGGRGRAGAYSADMDEDLERRARCEDELRGALANGDIVPYFQPLIDLSTGEITTFEVLSRWRHAERGFVPPAEFIPIAEKCSLINDLTFSVLHEACVAARDLPPHIRIAFNISPQQIEDEWLAEKILRVLVDTGFNASQLEIELTETALVNDLAAAKRVITSLKNLGVSIALDDFGTGYSSLCYLSELPFDKIKIDRSFVSSMSSRPESVKIIAAIISLGESLNVPTVAEGVEHESEATMLRKLGCKAAQGWFFERALPPADAVALLDAGGYAAPGAAQAFGG